MSEGGAPDSQRVATGSAAPPARWEEPDGLVQRNFTTGTAHGFRSIGRISPYFDGVERAGGHTYTKEFNTYVPWAFDMSPAEQYRALTERVVLWDTSSLRLIQVSGRDALALSDYVLTRDVKSSSPGRCVYGFVCDPRGVIVCDPVVLVLDEETVWFSVAGTDLGLWLLGIAHGRGFEVQVGEVSSAPLSVQGPLSRQLMEKLSEPALANLSFFRHGRGRVAGVDAVVSRTGWTGELGYEIYPLGSHFYGSSGMNVGPCGEPAPGDPVWAKTGGPLTVV